MAPGPTNVSSAPAAATSLPPAGPPGQVQEEGQGQASTRFKVVKIDSQRSANKPLNLSQVAGKGVGIIGEDGNLIHFEHRLMSNGQKSITFKRGRWTITDFYDAPPIPPTITTATCATTTTGGSNPSSNNNSTPSTPTPNNNGGGNGTAAKLPETGEQPSTQTIASNLDTNANQPSIHLNVTLPAAPAVLDKPVDNQDSLVPIPQTQQVKKDDDTVTSTTSSVSNTTNPTVSSTSAAVSNPVSGVTVDDKRPPLPPQTAAAPSTTTLHEIEGEYEGVHSATISSTSTTGGSGPSPTSHLNEAVASGAVTCSSSESSSKTSPSHEASDLTTLASVIKTVPSTGRGSPTKKGSVSGPVPPDAPRLHEAVGEVLKTVALPCPPVPSGITTTACSIEQSMISNIMENASGYATPQSIHSVSGHDVHRSQVSASSIAIDNKIEQAMDLVKSHLMYAVREEVDILKDKVVGLLERIQSLETENSILRNQLTNPSAAYQTQSLSTAINIGSHPTSPINDPVAATSASLVNLPSEVLGVVGVGGNGSTATTCCNTTNTTNAPNTTADNTDTTSPPNPTS